MGAGLTWQQSFIFTIFQKALSYLNVIFALLVKRSSGGIQVVVEHYVIKHVHRSDDITKFQNDRNCNESKGISQFRKTPSMPRVASQKRVSWSGSAAL
jgi:hypothetical protein